MKIDTLLIIGAAGLGLFLLASSLKTTTAAAPRQASTAASLNNYGNLPMTNGGGFTNTPDYLIFDASPNYMGFPMTNGGGFQNIPSYLTF